MALLDRQDLGDGIGERLVGAAGQLVDLDHGGLAHEEVHHDRIDPAVDRVVEDVEAHVALDPPGAEVDAAVEARGPGMGADILAGIGAELFHQVAEPAGMTELLEHDPGGRDPLLQAGREIDAVGEARGAGHLGIDEDRHQAHELAAIARRRVVRRAQLPPPATKLRGCLHRPWQRPLDHLSKSTRILSVTG